MKLQRRSFLTRAVEIGATLPLVGLIFENFRNRTSYYEIDSSKAQQESISSFPLDEMIRINDKFGIELDNLQTAYKNAYHIRHTRLVPYTYKCGKSTCTGIRTEVYYTWEEPSNVPDHTTIQSWKSFQNFLSDKLNNISKNATIKLDKLEDISTLKQRTNAGSEGLASLAIYTPQIAALLLYEETIAKLKHGSKYDLPAAEIVDAHDTPSQITRRSFFKAGAAIAGAIVSSPIVLKNKENLEEGEKRLNDEIEKMKTLNQKSQDDIFSHYFEEPHQYMVAHFQNQLRTSEETLKTNVENYNVKSAFEQFLWSGNNSLSQLENLLNNGVPKEVSDSIKSTMIAESLKDKSVAEHRAVYTGLGKTGLAVAATIAGVLIPLELANEFLTNRFENK